ncbi:MAG: serine/threonine protein kinase [Pseudohongiellaceae bacterium]
MDESTEETGPPQHPYSALTPELILAILDSLGLHSDARILALNSYENRVYRIGIEDGPPVIAKFYRPARWSDEQILEEHSFSEELAALEIPVVAPLKFDGNTTLLNRSGFRFALFPFMAGRAPEFDQDDTLTMMGRFIGRVHSAGVLSQFEHRPALKVESFAGASREFLLNNNFIPYDLQPAYESLTQHLIDRLNQLLPDSRVENYIRVHGDCHIGNVLWRDGAPNFVDFDDCLMGPPMQDLWMLLSGDRDRKQGQLMKLAEGYNDFNRFPVRELELVEVLRTLRIIHYSAWLARRWGDPAFPRNFPWFNTPRYWSEHILELREQMAMLDEAPLQLII